METQKPTSAVQPHANGDGADTVTLATAGLAAMRSYQEVKLGNCPKLESLWFAIYIQPKWAISINHSSLLLKVILRRNPISSSAFSGMNLLHWMPLVLEWRIAGCVIRWVVSTYPKGYFNSSIFSNKQTITTFVRQCKYETVLSSRQKRYFLARSALRFRRSNSPGNR